jgi:hypothetical protein
LSKERKIGQKANENFVVEAFHGLPGPKFEAFHGLPGH